MRMSMAMPCGVQRTSSWSSVTPELRPGSDLLELSPDAFECMMQSCMSQVLRHFVRQQCMRRQAASSRSCARRKQPQRRTSKPVPSSAALSASTPCLGCWRRLASSAARDDSARSRPGSRGGMPSSSSVKTGTPSTLRACQECSARRVHDCECTAAQHDCFCVMLQCSAAYKRCLSHLHACM